MEIGTRLDTTIPTNSSTANLSLSPAAKQSWTVTLWGRNILNKYYDLTRNFFLPGTESAQAGEPAAFGIRLRYRY